MFRLAILISILLAGGAYWRGSLSKSGAVAALLVGTLIFGFGGWQWGVLLGVFFVSASLLSHFKETEKQAIAEKFDKGHRRDMGQVFANGGVGALVALFSAINPIPMVTPTIWFFMFVGAMATVTADTWSTELGTLSKRPPRLITTARVVEVGTSGGISGMGTAVTLLGGLLIGLIAGLLTDYSLLHTTLAGGVGGLVGSLFDSLLGATVQKIYYSDSRQKETEKKIDPNGTPNRPLRGWRWMNNDMVNLLASVAGGGTAVVVGLFLGY